ncbi:DUF1254 domain-containing protein [Pseudopontixanthobacter vadosimaris]|uniref:DUF1254 domain-containing protein n=1 Tax=Pseudopontixanthobacter vadosimaris TaxID=2726450 RepID=UPI001475D1C3|nr:DUF1254 domain-containing protein [Pseudopontixanthobacter vadosimaris]
MIRWLGAAALFLVCVAAGHVLALRAAPEFIMSRAMAAMADRGVPLHGFVLLPRITPETQTVVRPSPDLAYSICRFDLAAAPGGIRVRAGAYDGMSSISVFDDQTVNIATERVGAEPAEFILTGQDAASADPALPAIESGSERGLILIRRLAPTAAAYDRVRRAAQNDACEPL